MTEDDLIAAIRERLRDIASERVLVGIGDDAAVWQPRTHQRSVITTDALVEGVHFTRAAMRAEEVGHR
ncbi:MAG: AIR synthase related protein, partial [Vulcanimicrobiaceae bacterium]